MRRYFALLIAAGLAGPAAAAAQAQPSCEIVQSENAIRTEIPGIGWMTRIIGPVLFRCTGGVTIRADSAVQLDWVRELQLMGRAFYGDSLKTINADWMTNFGADARLVARGNVVVTDLKSCSVVRAPEVEHFRIAPGRPEARSVAHGRPHATMRQAQEGVRPDCAAPDPEAEPLEIDADWMEFVGETGFRGIGNVIFARGDHRGGGATADFDQDRGRLLLSGTARFEGDEFQLTADTIDARMREDELEEATANGNAVLTSDELRLEAPRLRMFFEAGDLNRLVALGGAAGGDQPPAASPTRDRIAPPADPRGLPQRGAVELPAQTPGSGTAADGPPQARALANDFTLLADSIDAVAPGRQLRQVTAIGNAYGERGGAADDVELPEILRRDWVRGDTIIGYFSADTLAASDAAPDTPGDARPTGERALERIVAMAGGEGARTLHRVQEEGAAAGAPPSFHYMMAPRISVSLKDGEVTDVEAEGEVRGLHLQPGQATPTRGGETAAAPRRR
jgi:hypothetical protein